MLTAPAAALKRLLAEPGSIKVPCAYDGISALLIRQAGFGMTCLSGFETAAMTFGLPDTGYLTLTDMVDQMRRIARVVPGFPVLVDGETGYGAPANVRYTIFEHAKAGAAAIMIEDQEWPRRCPFLDGSRVIPRDDARMRIRAAVEACREAGILLLARSDARSSLGFEEAMIRIREFEDEGADMVVVEGIESEEELREFCRRARLPTIANQHPNIKTPMLSFERCQDIGLKMIGYHPMMPSAIRAMQETLDLLMRTGGYGNGPTLAGPRQVAELVGMRDYLAIEARYQVAREDASARA
jgi:2-methylisocitrate lyase-like PEP mutase family enzyme